MPPENAVKFKSVTNGGNCPVVPDLVTFESQVAKNTSFDNMNENPLQPRFSRDFLSNYLVVGNIQKMLIFLIFFRIKPNRKHCSLNIDIDIVHNAIRIQ